MTTNQSTEPIVKEVVLNAPAAQVWAALTDSAKMKEWYFDIPDFKPEVGFEFSFIGQDQDCVDYVHLCKVTEAVPNKKLTHSWRYKGYEGNSFVTWELFEEDGKTKLRLTHTGLETFPQNIKAFDRSNFNMGWTEIVTKNLPDYLGR